LEEREVAPPVDRVSFLQPSPLGRGKASHAPQFGQQLVRMRAKATWHRWIDHHVDHARQPSEADPLLAWFARHEP
jgi:hypothetical protein